MIYASGGNVHIPKNAPVEATRVEDCDFCMENSAQAASERDKKRAIDCRYNGRISVLVGAWPHYVTQRRVLLKLG